MLITRMAGSGNRFHSVPQKSEASSVQTPCALNTGVLSPTSEVRKGVVRGSAAMR